MITLHVFFLMIHSPNVYYPGSFSIESSRQIGRCLFCAAWVPLEAVQGHFDGKYLELWGFLPFECRWRSSRGTSTANILNCRAFCPLSAAGDRPEALRRQYLELWGFLPFECRWRSSRGTQAAIKPWNHFTLHNPDLSILNWINIDCLREIRIPHYYTIIKKTPTAIKAMSVNPCFHHSIVSWSCRLISRPPYMIRTMETVSMSILTV